MLITIVAKYGEHLQIFPKTNNKVTSRTLGRGLNVNKSLSSKSI